MPHVPRRGTVTMLCVQAQTNRKRPSVLSRGQSGNPVWREGLRIPTCRGEARAHESWGHS